jgi:16S rRNA (cytidine1402-2'-O)-methyltransferase
MSVENLTATPTTPPGRLYLVPAPLDFGCANQTPLPDVLPQGTLLVAARLQHWICENAKSARAYLKRVNEIAPLSCSIQALHIQELPHEVHKKGDHGGNFDARPLLAPILQGHDLGLLSEAGMPAVADPGSSVVRAAHDLGLEVVPLVGPASLLLALAASGLSGQNFAFVGYLPQDAAQRSQRIRELESLALKTGQTQLFIETPYRNAALLQALLQTLQHNTRLAVSSGLTLAQTNSHSDSVKHWKHKATVLDNATPAVFAIGR